MSYLTLAKPVTTDDIKAEVARIWNSPLEEGTETAAVFFVARGQNTFEDRGRADRIARLFTEATGVPCVAEVVDAPSEDRILCVSSVNRERNLCAGSCIATIDEALWRLERNL